MQVAAQTWMVAAPAMCMLGTVVWFHVAARFHGAPGSSEEITQNQFRASGYLKSYTAVLISPRYAVVALLFLVWNTNRDREDECH